MRIARIDLDGFGRFAARTWDLEPGLTVLVGPNEAGKTTLLNGIRALLFGFEPTRDGRAWYPALAGGRRGGRLVLETAAGERWVVERHGERGGAGSLAVRAPNGNTGGQETLDRLLAGADRELFGNVFAFGLGELQSIGSLSGEGVRSRIYGAGSGLGGMSAADLEHQLRQRQEAVFRPRGRDQELNALGTRIEDLRARIAELEQEPQRFEELHRELAALAAERERVDAERRAAAEAAARVARLAEAQEPAAALAAVQAELDAGDAGLDALPAGIDGELATLVAARDAAVEALAAADATAAALARRLDEITVDEGLLGEGAEVGALVVDRPQEAARAATLVDLRATIASAEAELAELARRAGGEPSWLLGLDHSVPAVQATREAEARLAAREAERATLTARATSLREALVADASPLAADGLDATTIAERRAALRELTELRLRRELGANGRTALPAIAVALAAGLLVGAIATLVVPLPWPVVAGVAAAAVAGLAAWTFTARPAAADPRWGRLVAIAGLPADADGAAIREAEDALATAAAALARGSGDASRATRLAAAERDLADAEAALAEERGSWQAWLEERGSPPDASPDAARQVLDLAAAARRTAATAATARGRGEETSAASDAYAARVDALLARLGRPAVGADQRAATVIALGDALLGARSAAERRLAVREQLAEAERGRGPVAERAVTGETAVAALLAAHGASDPGGLRLRAAAAAARRDLQAQARELRARLTGIAGGEARLGELMAAAASADPATLQVEREEAARRVAEGDVAAHELSTRAGQLGAELSRLEQGAELGERRQELSVAEGRAATLAREWAVRAVALRLLEETRKRYERERQPRVIQDATDYFERITGGAYERIVAAPGEATVRVEAATGAPRLTDELSRGTAEQLYLALRFGLIEQFGRTTEPLPVVMDDILVNFDAERAARAAAAVRSLAERHQVLYFTCHPWTAELLDPSGARIVTLD